VYKVMSENVSSAIATNGENVTKQPLIKSMRTVKRETLKLISGWVSRSNDPGMVSRLNGHVCSLLDVVDLVKDFCLRCLYILFTHIYIHLLIRLQRTLCHRY
jgi:hypothetical protein